MADLENLILKTGRVQGKGGIPLAVHYPAQHHIPYDLFEYKGTQQISPGRECLPLEMPPIPQGEEKLFIHSLIGELWIPGPESLPEQTEDGDVQCPEAGWHRKRPVYRRLKC
jgi:hypothetical protein